MSLPTRPSRLASQPLSPQLLQLLHCWRLALCHALSSHVQVSPSQGRKECITQPLLLPLLLLQIVAHLGPATVAEVVASMGPELVNDLVREMGPEYTGVGLTGKLTRNGKTSWVCCVILYDHVFQAASNKLTCGLHTTRASVGLSLCLASMHQVLQVPGK
jgi:hypothetical protein